MNFEIRKADRGDLKTILELQNREEPVIDRALCDKFDEILSQTNHTVLLAYANRKPIATLSVTIIKGIGSGYPKTVLSGVSIKDGYELSGVDRLLLESAQYIADGFEPGSAKRIMSGNYACKMVL